MRWSPFRECLRRRDARRRGRELDEKLLAEGYFSVAARELGYWMIQDLVEWGMFCLEDAEDGQRRL